MKIIHGVGVNNIYSCLKYNKYKNINIIQFIIIIVAGTWSQD
jgi:hypothetical protein